MAGMPLESADIAGVMLGATHAGNRQPAIAIRNPQSAIRDRRSAIRNPQPATRNRRMGEARDGVHKNANICRA
jgi:hypothetical protein